MNSKILSGFAFSLLFCLLLSPSAWAQTTSKYEFSAGYSYQYIDTDVGIFGMQGVHVSATRNLTTWLGITTDVAGYHTEGFRLAIYGVGPRVTHRVKRKLTVFGKALFGGSHANAGARGLPSYHDGFAMAFGGGADYAISERVSIRLVEADYQLTHLGGRPQDAAQITAGVVFRLGRQLMTPTRRR